MPKVRRGRRVKAGKAKRAMRKPEAKRPARRVVVDALLAPMKGATTRQVGGVRLDVAAAGAARVKRMVYPPGFRWSTAMKPLVGTDRCMHAHAGFLARGEIQCVPSLPIPDREEKRFPAELPGSVNSGPRLAVLPGHRD